jgi:hypothetical protein
MMSMPFGKAVAVVVGPTPEFGVERVDQLVEREVHHVALGQRLDAVFDVPERAVAGERDRDGRASGSGHALDAPAEEIEPVIDVGDRCLRARASTACALP